jgi:hypothetical protein
LFGDGLAWYSIDGSLRLFRQIAHVSAQMSQDHMQTADHLRMSKVGVGAEEEEDGLVAPSSAPVSLVCVGC